MLTDTKIKAFQRDLIDAVEAAGKKHGISAKQVGKLMYNPELGVANIKLMFAEADTTGVGVDPQFLVNTAKYGTFYKLTKEDVGTLVFKSSAGKEYTFVGMKNRNIAICKASDGQNYRINLEVVANAAGRTN